MGVERVLLAMPEGLPPRPPRCFIAPIGARAAELALRLGRDLRGVGVHTDVDGRGGSLKSLLRRADALGAKVCLVLGDAELDKGVVQVKQLALHQTAEVSLSDVVSHVQAALAQDEEAR
jgi:histidyl-tRNA synthetase